jgi:hypothetical protein
VEEANRYSEEVSSMTVTPVVDLPQERSKLARWAVGLGSLVAVIVSLAYAVVLIALAVGGTEAIEDNFVGYLGGISLLGGLLVALVAFVLGVVAKVRHESWSLLWIPLLVFPVLFGLTSLAELFWLE